MLIKKSLKDTSPTAGSIVPFFGRGERFFTIVWCELSFFIVGDASRSPTPPRVGSSRKALLVGIEV